MRISDWSSDVCSSDLDVLEETQRAGAVHARGLDKLVGHGEEELAEQEGCRRRGDQRNGKAGVAVQHAEIGDHFIGGHDTHLDRQHESDEDGTEAQHAQRKRSEEHTSELQSLMRHSYAVYCMKKKKYRVIQ